MMEAHEKFLRKHEVTLGESWKHWKSWSSPGGIME